MSYTKQAEKGRHKPYIVLGKITFFFLRFYLFIHETHTHTHTERDRQTDRESRLHAGSQMRNSVPGLQDHPGLKAGAKLLSHPGIPLIS